MRRRIIIFAKMEYCGRNMPIVVFNILFMRSISIMAHGSNEKAWANGKRRQINRLDADMPEAADVNYRRIVRDINKRSVSLIAFRIDLLSNLEARDVKTLKFHHSMESILYEIHIYDEIYAAISQINQERFLPFIYLSGGSSFLELHVKTFDSCFSPGGLFSIFDSFIVKHLQSP